MAITTSLRKQAGSVTSFLLFALVAIGVGVLVLDLYAMRAAAAPEQTLTHQAKRLGAGGAQAAVDEMMNGKKAAPARK
ncbi:hypothetical protein [Ramlibacter alkalitolerans]|uniref:Flp pilus-assembly TadG-like N-terminal domain-containing protein n=1 Tax=Ramlibacter alkalitolerans TaxID=2039631 RepID=A0ABS1JU44_9BURK|nr:hypothetical protein [Ramlibacter alkalitolerans]MBL0427737.1 hypothetical protein [Ramlibacter alkalitolerans]